MRAFFPPLFALALVACADAKTNPSQEIDPGFNGGSGGGGGSGGAGAGGAAAGSGNKGGVGGAGGGGAGKAGASAGGGVSQGGAGSSAAGAGAGGAPAGSGGADAGSGGDAGSGEGGVAGAGAGSGGAGAGGVFGGGGSDAGAGGDPGTGGSPFGGQSSGGGQPFGGMNNPKICPPGGAGGVAGGGGSQGIAGGFCAGDKLGNPNDDPCYSCWNASSQGKCQKAFTDCQGSPDCVAFFACWSSCPKDEDKCFANCTASVPAGQGLYAAVRDCVYLDACPGECVDQCEGIGSANRCNHDVCTTGYDLDPDCNPCATQVCDSDPTCCDFEWDGSCRNKAESLCKLDCFNAPPTGCVHSECATGAPLDSKCSTCAGKVCAKMPLCCSPFGKWDLACAAEADALCP